MNPTLKTKSAAAYIGMSEAWLIKARFSLSLDGPPYLKIGTQVRYRVQDLDAWLESRLVDVRSAGRR